MASGFHWTDSESLYYKHFQCAKFINLDKFDCPCESFGYDVFDTPPLTTEEKQLLHRFTFDAEMRRFTDMEIFIFQTKERFDQLYEELKFPLHDNANLAKNLIYSDEFDHQMERELQKRLCPLKCYYNPRECYHNENHIGKLDNLMKKDFHQQFNPRFEKQFERNSVPRLEWTRKTSYPSEGLNKLVDNDLGIWSKLSYDENGIAINFSLFSKENSEYGQ